MYKRYFRKKDPCCGAAENEWIEMTGREYYRFIKAPENKGRWFIDMGNVVLECTEEEYRCQRQSEIVRKRRRNFVFFRRGGNKIKRLLAGKEY